MRIDARSVRGDYLSTDEIVITKDPNIARACLADHIPVIGVCEDEAYSIWEGVPYLTDQIEVSDAYKTLVIARCKGFPWTALTTEHCVLRETLDEDLPVLYHIYEDKEIQRFVEPLYPYEEELAYQRDYRENVYKLFGYGMWTVLDKETLRVIGRAGLDPKGDYAELGYLLAKEERGKGLATELCLAILSYAKEELPDMPIRANVHEENVASIRLLKKIGFRQTPERMGENQIFIL